MNCKNCNSLIGPQTRFCAVCGTPIQGNPIVNETDQTVPAPSIWSRPMDVTTPQQPLVINPQTLSQQGSPYPLQEPESPFAETTSLPDNAKLQRGKRVPRRSLGGCLFRLTLVLVLLCAALAGAWFFVVQPAVHALVINKLDNVMTQAVDKIDRIPTIPPPLRSHLPPLKFALQDSLLENTLDNILKLNIAPSDPIQDPAVHLNQQGVRFEFNVHLGALPFSFPCAVSFLPTLDGQGNLVAQNVNIEGIASLALSPDDLTNLLNKHFADAITKLNHPISSLDWKQGEVDVTLSK